MGVNNLLMLLIINNINSEINKFISHLREQDMRKWHSNS